MPFNYPHEAPLIKFVPPIAHPNVDSVNWRSDRVVWDEVSSASSSKGIAEALQAVRSLLSYPTLINPTVPVRNQEASRLWENENLAFNNRANEEARQSLMNRLKHSDTSALVCDLLFPCKRLSREAQDYLFEAVAVTEVEEYVKAEYPPTQAETYKGRGPERDPASDA